MAWPSKARAPLRAVRSWALSLVLGILLVACEAGSALAAPARYQGSLDSMVRYLQNDQNSGGAGAGGDRTTWLAVAVGVLILLAILAGSQLERRRPQVIL